MSDGRAFGLSPYVQAGDANAQLMKYLGAKDNTEYRNAILARGEDIGKVFFQESLQAMDPIDQGCVPANFGQGPAPAAFR